MYDEKKSPGQGDWGKDPSKKQPPPPPPKKDDEGEENVEENRDIDVGK